MRLLAIGLLVVAANASAQATKQDTKTKQATKAPATQTKQDTKAPAAPNVRQQDSKTGAGQAGAAGTKAPGGAANAPAGRRPGLAIAPETTSTIRVPVIMREAYDYDAAGRRDPFFSLLATQELRPTVADLQVTTVLYHPTRPIAVLRDAGTKIRYTVTVGTTLGRMRVVQIKPKVVIFTIEEFGLNRQDSLVVADTTKARAR
jgi:hypothetical protein